ncbi:MAG: hypothetical protein Q8N26_32210, partial [Myxococcales bacterium]|nr:hypothetical protein [Myxococcales bacterium]
KTPLASLKLSVDELVTPTSGEAGRAALAELLYVEQLVENLRLEARLQQGASSPAGCASTCARWWTASWRA